MLSRELDELYVPQDERALRRLQSRVDDLDRRVRAWARQVIDILPRGLMLIEDELYTLGLFLAQQRRLNLEMDARNPQETFTARLARLLPMVTSPEDDWETISAAHRTVASRLESDIDRACQFFCQDRGIPPHSERAIDWRVAVRYLAQDVHRLATGIDIRKDYWNSPQRFEIALSARDQAQEIIERRRRMIAEFAPSHENATTRPEARVSPAS